MTIRKLQFDFPNHSNEKEKRRLSSAGEKQAPREGFMVRGVVVFFLFIQAGAWWFLCRLKQARLREPAEVRALSFP